MSQSAVDLAQLQALQDPGMTLCRLQIGSSGPVNALLTSSWCFAPQVSLLVPFRVPLMCEACVAIDSSSILLL